MLPVLHVVDVALTLCLEDVVSVGRQRLLCFTFLFVCESRQFLVSSVEKLLW